MIKDDPKEPLQHPKNMKNIQEQEQQRNHSWDEITCHSVELASPPPSLKKFLALPKF